MLRIPSLLLACVIASQPVSALDIDYGGVARWQAGYEIRTGQWQTNQLEIRPEISTRFEGGAKLTTKIVGRWDMEDQLEPGKPDQPFRSDINRRKFVGTHGDLELREFYLDDYVADAYFRAGKQQIVWGQADGLRVLDVINPLSYREFILPEMEDRRIPLWSVQVELPTAPWSLQLVWVPDTTVTEIPAPGSAFAVVDDPFNGNGALVVDRPEAFHKSDYGARLSRYWTGWDLTVNYLYHTIDDPLIEVLPDEEVIRASYYRSHLFGGTAANAFGNYTFRLEAGYESSRRYAASQTIQDSGEFSYVLGMDYSGLIDTLISGQFFQTIREDHSLVPRTEESITFLVRRDFLNQVVQAESLLIYSLEDGDSLWQLDVDYQVSTNLRLNAGADLFSGTQDGLLGRFHDRSRIRIGVAASF